LAKLRLPFNWKPRPYQLAAWNAWEGGIKRSLLVWHRRAGKDEISLHKAAVAGHERVANYWHCLPMYEQARKAIWEAVNPHSGKRRIDEAFPHEIRARTDYSSMTLEF
jgi:phage terminase large subunit